MRLHPCHPLPRSCVPLALGLLLAACATPHTPSPPPTPLPTPAVTTPPLGAATSYTGSLSYPARIALPPDTDALIEVLDSRNETRIAAERFALNGRQVPIPFTVDVPATDAALVLQASFIVNGRKRWRSQTLPISAAQPTLGTITLGPIAPSVIHYRCGEILVGFSPGEDGRADLVLPSRRLVLDSAETASGAKYVDAQDAGTWFWSKGTAASASIDGVVLPGCVRADATP